MTITFSKWMHHTLRCWNWNSLFKTTWLLDKMTTVGWSKLSLSLFSQFRHCVFLSISNEKTYIGGKSLKRKHYVLRNFETGVQSLSSVRLVSIDPVVGRPWHTTNRFLNDLTGAFCFCVKKSDLILLNKYSTKTTWAEGHTLVKCHLYPPKIRSFCILDRWMCTLISELHV